MTVVELAFPVLGNLLPKDHAYDLYAAISRILDDHLPTDVGISPIRGISLGISGIQITRTSRLRVRIPAERIGELLPLAGKFLNVGEHQVGLGVPEVRALEAAPSLTARIVTIKGYQDPESFLVALERQMAGLGVQGRVSLPIFDDGPRKGEHRRRVVKIKNRTVVGFTVRIDELSDRDSYELLVHGLGGRRHMGCGIFFPDHEQAEEPNDRAIASRQK